MCPKPVSSNTMNSTFGAPSRARLGAGHAGSDTSKVRPITPEKAWPGLYSLSDITIASFSHDAAEPQVARRRVDRLRHPRRRPVTPAIIRRAEVRAAFHHFPWNFYVRLGRIKTRFPLAALRIRARRRLAAARSLETDLAVILIPIRRPLPNVAGHVVKAIAV